MTGSCTAQMYQVSTSMNAENTKYDYGLLHTLPVQSVQDILTTMHSVQLKMSLRLKMTPAVPISMSRGRSCTASSPFRLSLMGAPPSFFPRRLLGGICTHSVSTLMCGCIPRHSATQSLALRATQRASWPQVDPKPQTTLPFLVSPSLPHKVLILLLVLLDLTTALYI